MEENDIIQAEDTAAEETTTTAEDTAPAEAAEETTEEGAGAPEESAAPEKTDDAGDTGAEEAPPFQLGVQFHDEHRTLTEEEAVGYAEKGLLYDELTPMLDKLRLMATGCNKSLPEMVDELMESRDTARLQQLMAETGGNEDIAKRLLKAEQDERQRTFERQKAETATAEKSHREQLTQRLAAEYVEAAKEFPELKEFGDIPESVVNTAIRSGIHLMDAYGRWRRAEDRKIGAAKETAAKAAASSTGSQKDIPPQNDPDPVLAALDRGLNAALGL